MASHIIGTLLLLLAPILVMRACRKRREQSMVTIAVPETGDYGVNVLIALCRAAKENDADFRSWSVQFFTWIVSIGSIIVLWWSFILQSG